METPHVYTAIVSVIADMAKEGIGKDSTNEQQRYRFRGIDSVYNALAPKLAAHGLCILPRVVAKEASERESKNGGVLLYTRLTVEFDLVSAKDGSNHTICTVGEAMDSADKSSNKAMSAAYKYAAFMAFCIPTEGDNDADATTHEVAASFAPHRTQAAPARTTAAVTNNGAPVCDICGATGRLGKDKKLFYCPEKDKHGGKWYTIPTRADSAEWDAIDAAAARRRGAVVEESLPL